MWKRLYPTRVAQFKVSMPMKTLTVLLALASLCLAQKKPVTLDAVASSSARRGGFTALWAPDGKSFARMEQNRIWQYDAATGKKKELITLSTLQSKAVPALEAEAFDWQN